MAQRNAQGQIRAGGGILVEVAGREARVLMVHRSRFGDWTIPRGKVNRGEDDETAALREVEEETGLACTLGPEAGVMYYRDRKAREKVARYWLMFPGGGRFLPNDEVDRCEWMPIQLAAQLATRSGERDLLAGIARQLRLVPGEDGRASVSVDALTVVHEEDAPA